METHIYNGYPSFNNAPIVITVGVIWHTIKALIKILL